MARIKVFIGLFIILFSQKLIAQVDTIAIRFVPDASTFKVKCIAQKVKIVSGASTFTDFEIADTINSAYTFAWSGTSNVGLIEDGLPVAQYEFSIAGNYTFTLTVYEDLTGKTYTYSNDYTIADDILVPNVFTPNGDGVNDLFIVRANGITPLEISIFSRTGTLVFNTRSPIIVWDGKSSSGAELSEGIYYYVLKSDDPAVAAQKGFFHLYNKNP